MGMTVQASKGSSSTLSAMRVEFLFCQNVPAILRREVGLVSGINGSLALMPNLRAKKGISTSQENDTIVVIERRQLLSKTWG